MGAQAASAGKERSARTQGSEVAQREDSNPLVTPEGPTSIADTVVAKIAGISTREVSGVHALGGGSARALVRYPSGSRGRAPTLLRV